MKTVIATIAASKQVEFVRANNRDRLHVRFDALISMDHDRIGRLGSYINALELGAATSGDEDHFLLLEDDAVCASPHFTISEIPRPYGLLCLFNDGTGAVTRLANVWQRRAALDFVRFCDREDYINQDDPVNPLGPWILESGIAVYMAWPSVFQHDLSIQSISFNGQRREATDLARDGVVRPMRIDQNARKVG